MFPAHDRSATDRVGVRSEVPGIAIEHFGASENPERVLKNIPMNYVKIDGSWKYQHLRVVLRMEADRMGATA